MSSRSDPTKAVEGEEALAEGDKHLSTGLLKWKPDYMAAEPCFQRAARAFKTAGLLESAVKAWRKAADCSLKVPNPKQAVVTLEAAARELSFASSAGSGANNYKETASAMLSEAGTLLYETGEPPRAAELKLRAGKLLEGFNNDRAAKLYDEAASYFDGDEVGAARRGWGVPEG
jgi:tetratricopeptide (TPR) repeat protein